jgi:peptidoglycan hydrolase CwlO-like protein
LAAPSPDQQQFTAMPLDLDAVRRVNQIAASQEQMTRSVERIAASQEQMARMVNQLTAGQEQLTRTVGQLTEGQEQLTREITKLQAIEQYILYKNSETPAPKPVPRQSQARASREQIA